MKKTLKVVLSFLGFLIFLIVAVLAYFGFVPGLSGVMGSSKPRDLGIQVSEVAYKEGLERSGVVHKALMPSEVKTVNGMPMGIVHIGKHDAKVSFTSQELTSAANRVKWVQFPFRDVQIRINDDGIGEASGVLVFDKIKPYLNSLGVSNSDINKGLEVAKLPSFDMPFYVKVSGGVVNNNISLDVKSIEVGRFPIPQSIISEYTPNVEGFLESWVKNDPSISIKKLDFDGGKVNFDGTLPDVEATVDQ